MQVVFPPHFPWPEHQNHNLKPGQDSIRSSSQLGSFPIWGWAVRIKTARHILAVSLLSHSEAITLHANIPRRIQQCLEKLWAEDSGPAPQNKELFHHSLCLLLTSPKESWRIKTYLPRQSAWLDSYR